MKIAFPEMRGFSKRNLEHMRRFAFLYPKIEFAKQFVSQLPWGHILRLLQMIDEEEIREWYAKETIKHGWSRSVLEMQVKSKLHQRQAEVCSKITNYHEYLPAPQSDLANQILKDPYNFDFLTIHGKAHERAIENA
jgi:predicted nuclease of restriction endonuclease-like (RecB) superfamily